MEIFFTEASSIYDETGHFFETFRSARIRVDPVRPLLNQTLPLRGHRGLDSSQNSAQKVSPVAEISGLSSQTTRLSREHCSYSTISKGK